MKTLLLRFAELLAAVLLIFAAAGAQAAARAAAEEPPPPETHLTDLEREAFAAGARRTALGGLPADWERRAGVLVAQALAGAAIAGLAAAGAWWLGRRRAAGEAVERRPAVRRARHAWRPLASGIRPLRRA
jgi:hypothetical protein